LLASRLAAGRSAAVLPGADAPAAPEATFPDSFLPTDLYVEALRKRVMLSLVNNQVGEALQAYEELKVAAAAAGKSDTLTQLDGQLQKIRELLASEEPVGSTVLLINGSWSY